VHGCGGVGLSAVKIAAALGGRVIAVDVAATALDLAASLGAEQVIDASEDPDPVATITEVTGGGVQVSIDALGSAATAVNSVRCLRRLGRHVQVGLLFGPESRPPIPMDLVIARELEILGSHGMAARDYPPMLAMIADRRLRPDLLVTRQISLDQAPAALAAMDRQSPAAGMTVINVA
jgi:threonine dehydrogenase-like Zn-dependent dehydrogenase